MAILAIPLRMAAGLPFIVLALLALAYRASRQCSVASRPQGSRLVADGW